MAISSLTGNRHFTWFTPTGRRPTQYESYTVGQQSSPEQWLHVDWPLRFDDGRAPFISESTALRCTAWGAFRDPTQTWQRPYVSQHNQQEQAIATLVPEALRDGLAERIAPAWMEKALGTYYAAWPFVEYGEFLCLSYAVREALADTLTFALAFEAADKLRHNQDIVHFLLALKEAVPAFSDGPARPAWMGDPILVPLRETIERIYSLSDWAEIVVALNLVVEPLAGELMKTELLANLAPLNGDAVTPMILASVRHDSQRHLDVTKALVKLVAGDREFGDVNRSVLRGWLQKWMPHGERAANALMPLFELPGIRTIPAGPRHHAIIERHRALITELGL